MIIIDSHLDLAWNAVLGNRDLSVPALEQRSRENSAAGNGAGGGTVAFPELRRARMAVCFATLLARCTGAPVPLLDYHSPAQAYGSAQGQLSYYRAVERQGIIRILTNLASLIAHIGEWQAWEQDARPETCPPLGFVLAMESADPILAPEDLVGWVAQGIRIIGPAHYGPGRYAGGTGTELGISQPGRRLLTEMQRLGVILDLTHCSDTAFWQALGMYDGPVLASHNNCRALVPHQRQFSDEQICAIVQRGGVVGAALDDWMLMPGWVNGQSSNQGTTLDKVAEHIDHVCQLAGSSRHAAIGSDLDGLFGREQCPADLETIADLQLLAAIFARRGYSAEDVQNVMHANWLRLLTSAWK